jgi:hypothetical protein
VRRSIARERSRTSHKLCGLSFPRTSLSALHKNRAVQSGVVNVAIVRGLRFDQGDPGPRLRTLGPIRYSGASRRTFVISGVLLRSSSSTSALHGSGRPVGLRVSTATIVPYFTRSLAAREALLIRMHPRSDHKLLHGQCIRAVQLFLVTSRFANCQFRFYIAVTNFNEVSHSACRVLGRGRLIEVCVTVCGSCFPAQPAGPRGSGTVPLVPHLPDFHIYHSDGGFFHRPTSLHVRGSGRVPSLSNSASDCKRFSHKIYLLMPHRFSHGGGNLVDCGPKCMV